ncbi:helicase-related protein [Candidatus Neomicrothrix sp.]|uniref:helicase-related protein n=1 Tax=Candidatus Neomicrothrix sp. TaxID=2719034 RepID=UPI0025C68880|nr:helicase-related protein [Candidatus Microthrix sp.]
MPTEVTVDHVGHLPNAAVVISKLHAGEKRLVFCDSRSSVEQLAAELRKRDVTTYVSHASLAFDERRRAEQAFAEGRDCVIVATSTLELGLDVGDLDRVIQINSTIPVASFLQRLGRTGRRPGQRAQHAVPHHRRRPPAGAHPRHAALLGPGLRRAGDAAAVAAALLAHQLLAYVIQEAGLVGRCGSG